MVKIRESGKYLEMFKEISLDNPELELLIELKVLWFQHNPNDTRLDNHPLTKRMAEQWAFSITDDVRIVYKWLGKNTVRFLAIGGHGKVYGRK